MLLLTVIFYLGSRNAQRIPSGVQNVAEAILEALLGFFAGVLGEDRARKYTPLLATFFLFILFSNYSGLIPGAGVIPGFKPPTSNWNVTGALAIIVLFSVHFLGVRAKGLSHFKHWLEPFVFFLPLNLLEEVARPMSLTLRLFGNIFGEETILLFLLGMAPFLVPVALMGLSLLLAAIQALVFTILATSYIGAATEEHH
ncbi:MAG: F0F1 ATP synthase subunit A [Firmicutes bacterium]|nr:F0F1 ATP synthase subunit A [Bacillota bacterium]